MARTPKDPNAPKTRKPAAPKPVFVVVGGDCPILGVFRKAEEVLKVLEENPSAKYTKILIPPGRGE
jgi:hypothetical protein